MLKREVFLWGLSIPLALFGLWSAITLSEEHRIVSLAETSLGSSFEKLASGSRGDLSIYVLETRVERIKDFLLANPQEAFTLTVIESRLNQNIQQYVYRGSSYVGEDVIVNPMLRTIADFDRVLSKQPEIVLLENPLYSAALHKPERWLECLSRYNLESADFSGIVSAGGRLRSGSTMIVQLRFLRGRLVESNVFMVPPY